MQTAKKIGETPLTREGIVQELETLKAKYDNLYLRHKLPSPSDFDRLANYVDIPTLQRIDDEDVIREMFAELRKTLLQCAEVMTCYDRMVKESKN